MRDRGFETGVKFTVLDKAADRIRGLHNQHRAPFLGERGGAHTPVMSRPNNNRGERTHTTPWPRT